MIKLTPEPRDMEETTRMFALAGIFLWLFWAVGFSFFLVAFEHRSFGDVFPVALKNGIWVGVVMGLYAALNVVSVSATVQFTDKKEFVARMIKATSQLGYTATSGPGDFLTFKPSFKTGGVGFGMVSMQLKDDQAIIVGPKAHVKKIVNRLEAI